LDVRKSGIYEETIEQRRIGQSEWAVLQRNKIREREEGEEAGWVHYFRSIEDRVLK
jgi:hypothetical protein